MPVQEPTGSTQPEGLSDPLDPQTESTQIPEPPVSDDTSGISDSYPGADVSGVVEEPAEDPLPEFDERCHEPFKGLLYLGALTQPFSWMGHDFVIRTLTTDEELAIALVVKEWDGTIGQNRAYAAAVCAACTVTVDKQQLPGPAFEESDDARLRRRFNIVASTWYEPTIDAVFEQFLVLKNTVDRVLMKMGEAYGQAA